MPTYELAGERFRRKNFYMPCVIDADFDSMTDKEKVAVYKATYWADNITEAEWKVVLDHDDATPSAKSRLLKKMVGWWMAMARIAALHPELYEAGTARAKGLYQEQLGEQHPLFIVDEPEADDV